MLKTSHFAAALAVLLLISCGCAPRRGAPPTLIDQATPAGFPSSVRTLTIDLERLDSLEPGFVGGIAESAKGDGTVNILVLSSGGASGAFGAGAMLGMSQAGTRPIYELVTGVSSGALIAPFAFLGSSWDQQLSDAFSGEGTRVIARSPMLSVIDRMLSPLGIDRRNNLARLVDHFATDKLIDAVARESSSGRRLFVATTNLDKQETVLWDMVAIAAHGGVAGRQLFRDVLIASASIPGLFPPVMIPVRDGGRSYDEMHVDGSVTSSLFAAPLISHLMAGDRSALHGAHIDILINDHLTQTPSTVPLQTVDILIRSFKASLNYNERQSLVLSIDYAQRNDMKLKMTSIPPDYPLDNSVRFTPSTMRELFDYGVRCAAIGQLWQLPRSALVRATAELKAQSYKSTCPAPREATSESERTPTIPAPPLAAINLKRLDAALHINFIGGIAESSKHDSTINIRVPSPLGINLRSSLARRVDHFASDKLIDAVVRQIA